MSWNKTLFYFFEFALLSLCISCSVGGNGLLGFGSIQKPIDAETIEGRKPPMVHSFRAQLQGISQVLVEIFGENFTPGAQIQIGGLTCSQIVVHSPNSISCMMSSPIQFVMTDIVITNPDGQASNSSQGSGSMNHLPVMAWVAPNGNDDFVTVGSSIPLQWTDADPDNDATITFFYKRSNSGSCSVDGTPIITLSENDETDATYWDTTNVADGFYYICARIEDGRASTEAYSERIVVHPASCTWVGEVSSDWSTAANWKGCQNGALPTVLDSVVILEQATHQPTLAANTTLVAFGNGRGGGHLTINPGVTLSLTSPTDDFASSVVLEGATPSCSTCRVASLTNGNLYIGNGATLAFKSGITALVGGGTFGVGSASATGHFIAMGGSNIAEWPLITAPGVYFHHFAVEGPAVGTQSSVNIDGLRFEKFSETYYHDIEFRGNVQIKKFDNLQIRGQATGPYQLSTGGFQGSSRIAINSCARTIFTDTHWTGIEFDILGSYNVSESSCTIDTTLNPGFSHILISGSGVGFAPLEYDPINILEWDVVPQTCTWNIAGPDRNWNNSANWLNCGGRYPEGADRVNIPAGGNQPQVSQHMHIWGFSGAGGGTIEITDAYTFKVNNSTFDSNIKFVGPAGTGKRAYIKSSLNSYISNGGVLTLGPAIGFENYGYAVGLYVGNNGAGTLKTEGGPNPADWPSINLARTATTTGSIYVNGSPTGKAVVSIDGLIHLRVRFGWSFSDNFQIDKMDNITGSSEYGTLGGYLWMTSCTGAVINDNEWSNFQFAEPFAAVYGATPYFISAPHSSCSGAGFAVDYGVTGAGPFLEDDPHNLFQAIP